MCSPSDENPTWKCINSITIVYDRIELFTWQIGLSTHRKPLKLENNPWFKKQTNTINFLLKIFTKTPQESSVKRQLPMGFVLGRRILLHVYRGHIMTICRGFN